MKQKCVWPNCEKNANKKDIDKCIIHENCDINKINDYINCKSCKKYAYQPNKFIKTCEICINKSKDKNKDKNICKAIKHNNIKCITICYNNTDYCYKHQNYGNIQELLNQNIILCKYSSVRGCKNIVDNINDKCDKCKKIEKNQNIKKQNIKLDAQQFNNNNDDDNTKKCQKCGIVDTINNFMLFDCKKCYEKQLENNINTDKIIKFITTLYNNYIENIDKDLVLINKNDFKEIIYSTCYYCGYLYDYNNVSRLNNELSYSKENCISTCNICKSLRNNYNNDTFLNIISQILYNNNYIFKKINFNNNFIGYENMKPKEYNILNNCKIESKIYNRMIKQNCVLCKNKFTNQIILPIKIDKNKDINEHNIIFSCKTCNEYISNFSIQDIIPILKKIYDYYYFKININEQSLKDKITNMIENYDKMIEKRTYLHDDDYYKNLIFNSTDIKDVENIKIKLVFVENDVDKDIWNYIRHTLSSFKVEKSSVSVGRNIKIIVKDDNSNKILGVMSLSSECYNIKERDTFINWYSNEHKNIKLQYIMNLSTCVPVYSFGYNFNGGKLLTSLAFSKEIFDYFNKKYNAPLLGITTFSLYGKSIQYDRLKCIKFIGYTQGYSTAKISTELHKLCKQYLLDKNYDKHINVVNKNDKLYTINEIFKYLGINNDILNTVKKGIYFGYLHPDFKELLKNKDLEINLDIDKYNIKNYNSIFNEWLNNRAKKRYEHLKETNRIKVFN